MRSPALEIAADPSSFTIVVCMRRDSSASDTIVTTLSRSGWGPITTGGLLPLGGDHSCGVLADNSLWCWGQRGHLRTQGKRSPLYRQVPTLIRAGTGWFTLAVGHELNCGVRGK